MPSPTESIRVDRVPSDGQFVPRRLARFTETVQEYVNNPNAVRVKERSTDPADPGEGEAVIWMSDGTGSGDDGDLMVKITVGGTTKTGTIIDFSGLP